jgi:hypothetical protein
VISHLVLHARFVNPQSALQIAIEEGIQEHIPMLQQILMASMPQDPNAPPPPGPLGPPSPGQAPPPPVV